MYSACLVLISLLMYMTIQDCLRVCKRTTFPVRVTPVAAQRTEVNAVDDDAAPELDDGETSIGVQGALDVAVSGGCTAQTVRQPGRYAAEVVERDGMTTINR